MNFREISCKCPKCGETFVLSDAIEEQAFDQIRSELKALNDSDIEARIEAEKLSAIEEGKKIATEAAIQQAQLRQKKLEEQEAELNAIKLSQIEKDSELKRLKQQQESTIALKIAQEKNHWEAEKNSSETALKLKIQQLTEDLRKASDRAQQGSMQAQGEASELAIENTLQTMFPSDEVTEIKKGQRGADCILLVKNNVGRPAGKILFESKDTKNFSADWIKKLKNDAISEGAQISVLVTSALPADNQKAHLREGVWICGFHEYQILVRALRQSLIDLAKVVSSEQAREEKAQVMYDFLTSQEFAHTVEQMISPIFRMHEQLQKEKRSITRLWKERETLIEGSISGTESLYMKIQGIARINLPTVKGLEAIEDLSDLSNEEQREPNETLKPH
ncbi:MAG: DUF2130 domain-containing protein [Rhodospirillaceae bacterium]|jgi:hypothetical protein